VARRWSSAVLPAPVAPPPAKPRGNRLRVGYLSRDFREHPTGRLMAGLFEESDRSRFDLYAYSYGPRRQRDAATDPRGVRGVVARRGSLSDAELQRSSATTGSTC
jgi:predicted O-linked N-acetylglucosamine transferase (SPINDLY family)